LLDVLAAANDAVGKLDARLAASEGFSYVVANAVLMSLSGRTHSKTQATLSNKHRVAREKTS